MSGTGAGRMSAYAGKPTAKPRSKDMNERSIDLTEGKENAGYISDTEDNASDLVEKETKSISSASTENFYTTPQTVDLNLKPVKSPEFKHNGVPKKPRSKRADPLSEAVNLELVSMTSLCNNQTFTKTPSSVEVGENQTTLKSDVNSFYSISNSAHFKNGDSEKKHLYREINDYLDVSPVFSNILGVNRPYGDYFVPVNERKKRFLFRSQKLYVTKDNRKIPKSRWRSFLIYTSPVILLCTIIVIMSLGSAGIINIGLNSSSSKAVSKKQIQNISATYPQSITQTRPVTTALPLRPYVANAIEGEIRLAKTNFELELYNRTSHQFIELATSLEYELMRILYPMESVKFATNKVLIKVVSFSPGSIISKFRVSWRHGSYENALTPHQLRMKLEYYLSSNGGFIHQYLVPIASVNTYRVINSCQFQNGGCSHHCEFSSSTLDFVCRCPRDHQLADDDKRCLDEDAVSASVVNSGSYDEDESEDEYDQSDDEEDDMITNSTTKTSQQTTSQPTTAKEQITTSKLNSSSAGTTVIQSGNEVLNQTEEHQRNGTSDSIWDKWDFMESTSDNMRNQSSSTEGGLDIFTLVSRLGSDYNSSEENSESSTAPVDEKTSSNGATSSSSNASPANDTFSIEVPVLEPSGRALVENPIRTVTVSEPANRTVVGQEVANRNAAVPEPTNRNVAVPDPTNRDVAVPEQTNRTVLDPESENRTNAVSEPKPSVNGNLFPEVVTVINNVINETSTVNSVQMTFGNDVIAQKESAKVNQSLVETDTEYTPGDYFDDLAGNTTEIEAGHANRPNVTSDIDDNESEEEEEEEEEDDEEEEDGEKHVEMNSVPTMLEVASESERNENITEIVGSISSNNSDSVIETGG